VPILMHTPFPLLMILTALMPATSWAQNAGGPPAAVQSPVTATPGPSATDNNAPLASQQALLDIGSNFLRRLGNQSTWGYNAAAGNNPNGGGASETSSPPTFRSWAESYGIAARTDAQVDFTGDRRRTLGGVVGIGATVLPGLNVGASVDQSNTRIDMPLALQRATLDLTQLGFNASYAIGAWTLAGAVVHGWGMIDSQRGTIAGLTSSNYRGRIDGALGELSYYSALGQGRVVPKIGFEYVHAETDSFQEFGGFDPVTAATATGERARVLIGAEVGHYRILDRRVLDVSAYGKFVDNVVQNFSPVTVSANGQSVVVQGILESRYGADAGAGISYGMSNSLRLYANYDGRFRANFVSHQGTAGVEVKW
jgi:uncharacterized protein with beta-barrel porin domain